jgi:RNA polymerase sigma-70 factor, ECF subfamily
MTPFTFEPSAELRAQLVKMARCLSRGELDAEDIVQDVIVAVLARFARGEPIPRQGLEPFLFASVRNAVTSKYRRLKVQEHHSRQLGAEEPAEAAPADAADLPSWRLVSDEEVEAAIQSLSARQREAFLAVTAGETYAGLADRLGISVGAVSKRVFDARVGLRRRLLRRSRAPLVELMKHWLHRAPAG